MSDVRPVSPGLVDIGASFRPVSQMRQISRVTARDSDCIEGEMQVGSGHWVFAQHFPGDPIFPGVLLIEAAGQLVALWAWEDGQRGRPRLVRSAAEFREPVGPDTDLLHLRGTIRKKRNVQFATVSIEAAGRVVASVEIVLTVLPAA